MITYCPECKAKYDLPDSRKGVKFRCKICGGTVYTDDLRRVECLDPFGIEAAKTAPAPKPAAPNVPGVKPAAQAFESHSKLDAMEDDLFDFSDTRSMSGDIARQAVEEAEAEARKAQKPAAPAAAKPAATTQASSAKTPAAKPSVPAASAASAAPAAPVAPVAPVVAKAPEPQPVQEAKTEKTAIFKSEPLPEPQEAEEELFDFGEDAPQTTVSQQQVAAMPDEGFGEGEEEDALIDFGEETPATAVQEPLAAEEPAISADAFGLSEEPATSELSTPDEELILDEELLPVEEPVAAAPEPLVMDEPLALEEPAVLEEPEAEQPLSLAEEEPTPDEELPLEEELLPLEQAEEPVAAALDLGTEDEAVGLDALQVEEELAVEDELIASEPLLEEELEEAPATVEEIALAAAEPDDLLADEVEETVVALSAEEMAVAPAPAAEPELEEADDLLAEELEPADEELAVLDGMEEAQPEVQPEVQQEVQQEPAAVVDELVEMEDALEAQPEPVEAPIELDAAQASAEPDEAIVFDTEDVAEPALSGKEDFAQAVARWRKVIHDDNDLQFVDDDPADLPEAPVVDLHALFPPRKREVRAVCSACNARYHLPEHYSGRRKLRCAVCSQPVSVLPVGADFPPLPVLPEALESPAEALEELTEAMPEPVESQALAEAEAVAAVEAFEAEVVADAEAEAVVETFEEEEALALEPAAEAAGEPDEVELDLGELDGQTPQEEGELDLDAALEEEAGTEMSAAPEVSEPSAPAPQEDVAKASSARRPQRMEIKPRPKAGEEDDSLFDFGDATGLANVITGSDSSVYSPITNDTAAEMKKKKKTDGEQDEDLIDWE